MTPEEIIEFISTNSSGEISEPIIIKSQNYELNCKWKRNIKITIRPKASLITETGYSEIRKLSLISLILRAPNTNYEEKKLNLPKIYYQINTHALCFIIPLPKLVAKTSKFHTQHN